MNLIKNFYNAHKVATIYFSVVLLFIVLCAIALCSDEEESKTTSVKEIKTPNALVDDTIVVEKKSSDLSKIQSSEIFLKKQGTRAKEAIDDNVVQPLGEVRKLKDGTYVLPPLELYHCSEEGLKKEREELSENAVPRGRLLSCQLITTLESFNESTPIIGIVTESLWWNGKLIIPAGVEVHGQTQAQFKRDKIFADGEWQLVWTIRDEDVGKTLNIQARMLEKDRNLLTNKFGISNMSGGVKGEVIRSTNLEEIKLFLAKFAGAFSDGLRSTAKYQTPYGVTEVANSSLKNATYGGVNSALESYAQRVLDEIKESGVFVRVTAGTQFYLYITQPIDPSKTQNCSTMAWKESEKEGKVL